MRFLTPFLAAAALAPAFVPPLAQADTIKVGIANDISGPFAALGAEARDGFNLAIKQLGSKLGGRSEEHTSELQSTDHLVCRLLLEKKNKTIIFMATTPPSPHPHSLTQFNILHQSSPRLDVIDSFYLIHITSSLRTHTKLTMIHTCI